MDVYDDPIQTFVSQQHAAEMHRKTLQWFKDLNVSGGTIITWSSKEEKQMNDQKKLRRVVVAIAEKRDAEGKLIRDMTVIHNEYETSTANDVSPVNIIRRSNIAEMLTDVPAEEILTSARAVALECPFLG